MAQLRRFGAACLLTLVAFLSAGAVIPTAAHAAIPSDTGAFSSCSPNDTNPSFKASPLTELRCINGTRLSTRNLRILPHCMLNYPTSPTYVYQPNDCGGSGAEAIGHTRAIAYLNSRLPSGAPGGITPDVQWEANIGGSFPDILYYDHTAASPSTVQVIEAKVWNARTYAGLPAQVQRYLDKLHGLGMPTLPVSTNPTDPSSHAQTVLDRWGDYNDFFRVEIGGCPDGKSIKTENYHAYTEDDRPYVLAVRLESITGCPQGDPPVPPLIRKAAADEDTSSKGTQADGCVADVDITCVPEPEPDDPVTEPVPPEPTPAPPVPAPVPAPVPVNAYGDPHLATLDGLSYDLQAAGEFDLAVSKAWDMDVQARFTPASSNVSVLSAIALRLQGHSLEMRSDGSLLQDGTAVTLPDGQLLDYGGGAALVHARGQYWVLFPGDGDRRPVVSWSGAAGGRFGLYFPPGGGDLAGLLGNANANPKDDLALRDGTPIPANASPVELHGTFADSWRITDATSMFTYGPGQSTATFTDRAFPAQITTTGDFTPEQQNTAAADCQQVGVPAGPQFDDCILDVLTTGNLSFAEQAATVTRPLLDAHDATTDATGQLTVGFNGTVPPNFVPTRLGADPALGQFAGPLSGSEQYRFYVPALPSHLQASLSFDLIGIGDWDLAGGNAAHLDVDGARAWDSASGGLTQTGQGTLASGQPYRIWRVTVPVAHSGSQLAGVLSVDGLDAHNAQGFAVDNLTTSVQIVPPQTFAVDPTAGPVTVALDQPAPGAGNLETKVSADAYTFTVPAGGQSYYLDMQSCLGSWYGRWTLLDGTGTEQTAGQCADGDRRLDLTAGTYTLRFASTAEVSGSYGFQLFAVPDPQVFDVPLPGPDRLAPGTVGEGAGTLETKASEDVYRFSLPAGDRGITLHPVSCPGTSWNPKLAWSITDAAGATAATGSCAQGDQTVPLPGGTYQLHIRPENETTGSYELQLAQLGPAVTITDAPPAATRNTTASFTFGADRPGSTFECRLDGPSGAGTWAGCTAPASYPSLPDGAYTFNVRATDPAGNAGPAVTAAVQIDTTLPVITFDHTPPALSNYTGNYFTFHASKPSSFECSLVPDSGVDTFSACGSPYNYSNLGDGSYRLTVRATDTLGNVNTANTTFAVDLTPPQVTLNVPAGLTRTTAPSFTFTANEPATFECSLVLQSDADSFAPCTSPAGYSGLANGSSYRFSVRATDRVGQRATSYVTWTVNSGPPPTVTITPPAGLTGTSAPTFSFTSSVAGSTFSCSLVASSAADSFTPCTSPKSYTGLVNGTTYRLAVKATDPYGNTGTSTLTWTVALSPPTVTITSAPASPSNSATPTFGFSSPAAGASYACSLVPTTASDAFSACASPKVYTGVGDGSYRFAVKVTDANGQSATASQNVTIDTAGPTAPGTPTAALTTSQIGADTATPAKGIPLALSWPAASDPSGVASYEIWSATGTGASSLLTTSTGPSTTANLAPGSSYNIKIRAKDAAGNLGPFSTVTTVSPGLDQESSTRFAYTGTWTTASLTGASGGSVRYATAANAAATFTVPAGLTRTALVGTTGPGYGKITVTIDGNTSTATTLDLYSASASPRKTLLTLPTLSAGTTHTIKITVLGTKNTAATGTRADIDALITSS